MTKLTKPRMVRSAAAAAVAVVALVAGAGTAYAVPELDDEVVVAFESGSSPRTPGSYQWVASYSGDAN